MDGFSISPLEPSNPRTLEPYYIFKGGEKCWNIGILEMVNPIIPLFHYSSIPVVKRSGTNFVYGNQV
jgi:hypothetical protein